ncbi:MAG: T9SS type A sorting domain-containing protein, partial [Saprospiraceae bacterium]
TITIDYDRPSAVRLVDLDNDNDLDVLFSTQYYTNLWCGAIENTDGQGNFGFVQPISAGSQSFGIVNHATVNYADFNGDGKTDAMALSGYNDKMVWFQNLLGYPSISGNCFIDYNENQIKDPDEVGWFSQRVNLSSNSLSNFSTTDGYYRFVVNDGDYVVSAPPEENWYLTTSPENYSVTVQDAQGAANLDFGFAPNEIFSEVEPSTSSTFTRCGFISMFWLNYTNTGTNFDSGFISFQFDELTTFVEADIQPDSIDNNTLFWNYNNLPPTFNEKIRIQLQMPDVDFIGDTVSFEARSFIVDDTGDAVLSKIDNYQSVINCAYDPNDKLVVPSGFTQEKLTLFEDELEYTIRFQNTGTDTAFTVNIKDQLDIDLDWSTFRPIAASHPYIVNLHNDGLVVFDFENIMLPDSNVNELESHGFVKYRIKSLDNLPENTEVHNYADICFDFNPPIQTNTTLNRLISAYPFEISDTIRHPICAGSEDGSIEIDLWAIEPVFYDWDNSNLSGPNNENLLAGTYEVTITDGTGGTAIQSFVLTEPPVLSATLSSTPQSSALFGTASVSPSGGTPPYSVQWSTNPPQSDTTVIDLVAGNYMVTIIDYNGCSYVDSINVGFLNNVTENKNRFDCIISPNPTTGGFSIGFSKPINADLIIEITNYAGKKVFEEKISGPVQSILHNQDQLNLSDGVYFINIKIEDQMLHKKIIILND